MESIFSKKCNKKEFVMKILILSISPRFGSIGSIVSILQKGYNAAGHTVKICYGFHEDYIEDESHHKITPIWEFRLSAFLTRITGYEGIYNPIATNRFIKTLVAFKPDIVQLTNIHAYWINEYKVLDYLKKHKIPTIYSMMDEYSFLGRCTFSLDCEKYKTGCGKCPNLKLYPKTWFFDRSATIYKWKEYIYNDFKDLHMVGGIGVFDKASKAPLLRNHPITMINEPQDFDNLFYHRDTRELRQQLAIPKDNKIIMCITSLRDERKGGYYFIKLCERLKDMKNISFVYVGFNTNKYGKPKNLITFPFINSLDKIAEFYSLADLLFFGSEADTTPNTVLQSLGCGTPVICFDIKGIACMNIVDKSILNMVPIKDLNAVEDSFKNVKAKTSASIEKCHNSVYTSFGAPLIIKQYLELFENVKKQKI